MQRARKYKSQHIYIFDYRNRFRRCNDRILLKLEKCRCVPKIEFWAEPTWKQNKKYMGLYKDKI